jgi:hypothetical protein
MYDNQSDSLNLTLVAIDIAKKHHDTLIQFSNGKTLQMKLDNLLSGCQRPWDVARKDDTDVRIGF